MAKQLIPSFLENQNGENILEDLNLSALSSGKGNSIDLDSLVTVQEKTVDINQRNFDIATTLGKNLKEVSECLLDPDVIYVLKNLKVVSSCGNITKTNRLLLNLCKGCLLWVILPTHSLVRH